MYIWIAKCWSLPPEKREKPFDLQMDGMPVFLYFDVKLTAHTTVRLFEIIQSQPWLDEHLKTDRHPHSSDHTVPGVSVRNCGPIGRESEWVFGPFEL